MSKLNVEILSNLCPNMPDLDQSLTDFKAYLETYGYPDEATPLKTAINGAGDVKQDEKELT